MTDYIKQAKQLKKMIYTIEKRSCFGYGEMESWWEARSYERRTPIGILVGGKCLKKSKKKSDCCDYFGRKGLQYEEI